MVALFILGVSLSTLMEVQPGGGELGLSEGHWGLLGVIGVQ